MSEGVAIGIAVALLIGNAFFVGAEFALVTARRTQIEPYAQAGGTRARWTLRAIDNVAVMMAGCQLGITLCSLGLGAVAEPAVAHLVEPIFEALGVPAALLHPIAFVIAMTIVVFLHMVLGEMVPKNIALAMPDGSALLLGPPLYLIAKVLNPLLWLMNTLANLVLRLMRIEPTDEVASTFTKEQVLGFITESHEGGLLEDNEHELMTGVLQIESETSQDVLVPLKDLVVLSVDVTAAEAEAECVRTGFSRYPLADAKGDLVAYLHLKDILGVPLKKRDEAIDADLRRPLPRVDADAVLADVLEELQRRASHVALVTHGDEVLGAAMLEDVVERLVGEVADAAQVRTS